MKKTLWILFVVLAILVGLYPTIYFLIDREFGLLSTKSPHLLANLFWNIFFYTHIILGGIALLIGWPQFSTKLRIKHLSLHRSFGKIYIIAVLLSSTAGIYIGFFATGGMVSSVGFISLGIIWFFSTLKAYLYIRNKNVLKHQKVMIYSYASCFSAVTLRLWLPILIIIFGDFTKAYTLVAWLCWVPNIFIAFIISRNYLSKNLNIKGVERL